MSLSLTARIPIALPESCFDCPLCVKGDYVASSHCLFTNVIPVEEWRQWGEEEGPPSRHPLCPLKEEVE